jgi:hypothetical protein
MTTIENPATEKMNGSSRMTTFTDSPWWFVRPSLAASLAASFALAAGVFRFAGTPTYGTPLTPPSLTDVMQFLSATPTLIAFGVLACMIAIRRTSRGSLRTLSILLAVAAFAGAGINSARDSFGRGPIEVMVEKALADAPALFAGK